MTDTSWERLKAAFAEALELEPAARASYLAEIARSDAELGSELAVLLEHHEDAPTFLEKPATEIGLGLVPPAPPPEDRIGPYRVERELASGGMGSVYLGERDDDLFDQRVAIKTVRADVASDFVERRFESEMRILAQLEHPNIARLLDGGVTSEGRLYFVMEYIDGEALNRYCTTKELGLEARLDLFGRVCEAVHFAHQNLVIHRDLKPSNVLVDERGDPKLLDFGIAKLVTGGSSRDPDVTQTEARFMSTGYASPEQVRHEALTTASDVYSLGVILYELLTGVRPHDIAGLSPADTERTLAEVAPKRPSIRAEGSTHGVPARALKGDLDTIVLKALHKDPGRRYPSAEALAVDLQRFRSGLPITARGDGLAYRASKFVRRHAWGVSVSALIALLIVAATVTVARQSVQVRQERDRAAVVSEVLVDVFGSADPRALGQREITARELLDRGVERVESRFTEDPITGADLLDVIAQAYQNVGEFDRAQSIMERSLEMRRAITPPPEADIGQSLNDLGNLALLQRRIEDAEPLLLESLAIRRSVLEAPHAELAQSLNNLGQLRLSTRDFEAADTLLGEALTMQRALYSEPDRDLAITLQASGLLHQIRGEFDEAEAFYEEAAGMQRAVLGAPHPDLAQTLNNLGLLRQTRGDFDGAEPLLRESLEMRQAMLGEDHPMIGIGLHNLALLVGERGDFDAALPLFERALALSEAGVGRAHPQTATVLNNLGGALSATGRLDEASTALEEALAIRQGSLPDGHPHLAFSYNAVGLLRLAQGRNVEARSYVDQAVGLRRGIAGGQHPDLAVSLDALGQIAMADEAWEEAAEHFDEALALRTQLLPSGHPHTSTTRVRLGVAQCRAGVGEASGNVEEGLATLAAALGSDHRLVGTLRAEAAAC